MTCLGRGAGVGRPKTSNVQAPFGPGSGGLSGSILLGFAVSPRLSAPVSRAPAMDILNLNPSCRSTRLATAQALGSWPVGMAASGLSLAWSLSYVSSLLLPIHSHPCPPVYQRCI